MSADSPLHAPAANRAILAVPPLPEIGATLQGNRQRLAHFDRTAPALLGRSWHELRLQARREAVEAARAYLADNGEPVPEADADAGLIVAGHQPELFHPGVWVKNFALAGVARAHSCTPLNLVVDSDTVKATALRVPVPRSELPALARLRTVPFDRWTGEVPYEERSVAEPELFETFADRVTELLRGWGYEPLLPRVWAEVLRRYRRTPLLGECLVAARRALERAWGSHNLEVPQSALCCTPAFGWFAGATLADLPRFAAVYNEVVRAYRVRHRVRRSNHPVPDLAVEGDWYEAPLWGWRAGQSRRCRVFARLVQGKIELRAGQEPWSTLPGPAQPEALVRALGELEAQGYKLRSRALVTTLFARLALSDLFIHGIGGSLYDELTDDIMRRYYSVGPPRFLVLSATLWLPMAEAGDTAAECRRLAQLRRDLHFNPQRHLGSTAHGLDGLAAQRQGWVERVAQTRAERHERFRALRTLTERLRAPLSAREEELGRALAACKTRLASQTVLRRRDYAFCLYPEPLLRPFCTQFLGE